MQPSIFVLTPIGRDPMNTPPQSGNIKAARPKLNWFRHKFFSDPDTGVAILLEKSDGFRPRYGMKFGRLVQKEQADGKKEEVFFQNVSAYVRSEHGKVTSVDVYSDVIPGLLKQVATYVEAAAQEREDEIVTEQQSREERKYGAPDERKRR